MCVPDGSVKKNFSAESRNRDRSQRASSDPQLKDLCGSHALEQTVGHTHTPRDESVLFPVNSKNQSKSSGNFHVLAGDFICVYIDETSINKFSEHSFDSSKRLSWTAEPADSVQCSELIRHTFRFSSFIKLYYLFFTAVSWNHFWIFSQN